VALPYSTIAQPDQAELQRCPKAGIRSQPRFQRSATPLSENHFQSNIMLHQRLWLLRKLRVELITSMLFFSAWRNQPSRRMQEHACAASVALK